ncbi:diguanylate cyclase [Roseospirillum parvum]|uniref:diguanylate cyclase n=1 Tax=Roseospirillum parvum TaxID=83401 RepID=A0A1G7UPP9_9PROT|nr:diguanylate cyclase [Roseospirillum parvum]SDG48690.1 PAS domain S-box-containing protein/diguanylate cyclase (GGDEF) domain-containing protein [Roseospirillum parvum]
MPVSRPSPTALGARQLLASGLILVLLAALAHFAVQTERDRLSQALHARVVEHAAALRTRLEAELNANVFLANGLLAHVQAMDGHLEDSITAALAALHRFGRHVRNIGVAPGNRISEVYPVEGNEAAIGLYYPDLPGQWPAVKRAIDSGRTVLAGPVNLRQGGRGLISRTPVFLDDGEYWGILSLVLDADSLFTSVGLTDSGDGFRHAVKGTDGRGAEGEVFLGDPTLFQARPVTATVAVPGGTWILAAAPQAGWRSGTGHLVWIEGGLLVLAVLLAGLTLVYQSDRLRIAASEARLRAFMETTRDAVIVIDDAGMIQEFNPAACELFGYDAEEMTGTTVNRLMTGPDAATHDAHVRAAPSAAVRLMGRQRRIIGRRRDGSEVPLEIAVSQATIGDQRLHVGVARDITEREAVEARLRQLADTDGLTGLLNRRAFMESLEALAGQARRYGRPLSLLTIDADHFKRINDTHGHPAGDAVLVHLAALVRAALRDCDQIGRLGGEEFAALLPETDAEGALRLADRLLETVRTTPADIPSGPSISFTVSLGVATLGGPEESTESLLQRADQALYGAKAGGRDRAVAAPGPAP